MSLKDEFLALKTFEEYEKNKEKFDELEDDKEVIDHFNSFFKGEPDMPDGFIVEVYPVKGQTSFDYDFLKK